MVPYRLVPVVEVAPYRLVLVEGKASYILEGMGTEDDQSSSKVDGKL